MDAKGRTIRYAHGAGFTSALSVCPGSDVFAELVTGVVDNRWWKVAIAVREVTNARVTRRVPLHVLRENEGIRVGVRRNDRLPGSERRVGRRLRTRPRRASRRSCSQEREDERQDLREARSDATSIYDGGRWFVVQGTALREVDRRTGRLRHVGTVPPGTQVLEVSPDAKHVVLSSTGGGDPTKKRGHYVLDVEARRIERVRMKLYGYALDRRRDLRGLRHGG